MTDHPDTITVAKCHPFRGDNFYITLPGSDRSGVQYIRADLAASDAAADAARIAELETALHDAICENFASIKRLAAVERKLAEVVLLRGALTAIEKLALHASIASCTCHTKTPDITFHSGDCRYVLLQYIIAQCEDALQPTTQAQEGEG